MHSYFKVLLAVSVPYFVYGQPVVNNAEDFNIGMVLQFQKCSPVNINPGNAGANQVWDFSGLQPLPGITTEWMVSPSSTPFGSAFPTANLVEKYSDGRFVYVNKSGNQNYLVGFADTTSPYPPTSFPDPMLFAQRPLVFGTVVTDTFTLAGSPATGIITIDPDAWGTLILPYGTFNNVLRVKITEVHPWFTSIVYTWFDGVHASALLKMDSEPTVEYLVSEITGIENHEESIRFSLYPNPAGQYCVFRSDHEGELIVYNLSGQMVFRNSAVKGENIIPTGELDPGCYHISFISGTYCFERRFMIKH